MQGRRIGRDQLRTRTGSWLISGSEDRSMQRSNDEEFGSTNDAGRLSNCTAEDSRYMYSY
ncbi:hypothetical protein K449DRAFT_89335 [Hypoxylon sp. EC38]|nr:hypothetical protein K449DRAFT_89335 [Hypoxylon sp. EC38]